MNQEYEYYRPGEEQTGNGSEYGSPEYEHPKPPKKRGKGSMAAKVAGLAVLFGVVGGLSFQGVNYISGKSWGQEIVPRILPRYSRCRRQILPMGR